MPVKNQLVLITTILFLAACGQQSDEPAAVSESAEDSLTAVPQAASPPALTRTPSAEGARVFFLSPADGSTVSGPVSIEFGLEGMQVTRAGDDTPASGHHHLLVDTENLPARLVENRTGRRPRIAKPKCTADRTSDRDITDLSVFLCGTDDETAYGSKRRK